MIEFGFDIETKGQSPKLCKQVHGNELIEITDVNEVRALRASPPTADGVFTLVPDVEVYVYTADCVPVLLHSMTSRTPRAVAAVHAGWKGANARIVEKAVQCFSLLGLQPAAILGPSIRSCCYQVKEDFLKALRDNGHDPEIALERRNDTWYFDVPTFIKETQLRGLQVDASALRCTYCDPAQLPSFRRLGNTDLQFRSWIKGSPDKA